MSLFASFGLLACYIAKQVIGCSIRALVLYYASHVTTGKDLYLNLGTLPKKLAQTQARSALST